MISRILRSLALASSVLALMAVSVSSLAGSNIVVEVTGLGTVVSSPEGISCPGVCEFRFKRGTIVVLSATPDDQQEFLDWGGSCDGFGGETCELVAGRPLYATALFSENQANTYPAPVLATGQTLCWDELDTQIDCFGTGQDGEHQAGVPWPDPRFVDNDDGTVTDNATGLMWKKVYIHPTHSWYQALATINALNEERFAGYDNWRLPNIRELLSLTDYQTSQLPIDCPIYIWNGDYWSSTTISIANNRGEINTLGMAYMMELMNYGDGDGGMITRGGKSYVGNLYFSLPVRGP